MEAKSLSLGWAKFPGSGYYQQAYLGCLVGGWHNPSALRKEKDFMDV